jgi:hypothetical protein
MPNSLSILHCNIRNLPKNLNILEDILYSLEYAPNVLGITEKNYMKKHVPM